MASSSGGTVSVSLRNGFRCVPEPTASIEDVLIVVGDQVGHENINSASRMNKAVVVFLKTEQHVNQIIENGLWVKGMFVPVTPLYAPATKVTISNVPPFIKSEVIVKELSRFGKVVSPVKVVPLGCKNPALKHVMSFRRQVHMFLNSQDKTLDVSFRVNDGDSSYVLYASTESLRCFECGDIGHKRFSCPHKNRPEEIRIGEEQAVANENTTESQGDLNREPEKVSEGQGVDTGEENEVSAISSDSAGFVQEEQPCCSSKIAVKAATAVENVLSDGVVSVSQDVEVVNTAEDVGFDEVLSMSQTQDDGGKDDDCCSDISDCPKVGDDLYNVEQINEFLDETKGKKVNVADYFPDVDKFVASVVWARKMYNFSVLSQQKRFRLKKHIATIRQNKRGKEIRRNLK